MNAAQRLARQLRSEGECLVFTGTRNADAYGAIRVAGRMVKAHRLAWELVHGPIPPGLVVCHRCDNPPCCYVEHLFLGTVADNNRDRHMKGHTKNLDRGRAALAAKAAAITACPSGHPYDGDNLRFRPDGRRRCATCYRERSRRARANEKETTA